jgi:hypothetical protein
MAARSESDRVERLMELLWPTLRQVTGTGGRTQYFNIEETRSLCANVLAEMAADDRS